MKAQKRWFPTVALVAFASIAQTNAADISGTVRSAIPDYATVTTDSDLIPVPGDKAEIFFKMAGDDIEVSVANGHVHEITGPNIMVKIDKATGTVAKDQLVRIKSPGAKKRPPPTYLGVQMNADPEGANGARVVEVLANSPAAVAGFQLGDLIVAIDGSPVESPDQVSNVVTSLASGTRHPFLVSRDGKMKKLEATLAQLPPELAASTGTFGANPLQGEWIGTGPDDAKVSFSFKADNSVLWVVESPDAVRSTVAKYRVDKTVTPHVLQIFDIEEGETKGEELRGIFELQSDGLLKLDLSIGQNENPEAGFTAASILFSRATTPIVRPPPNPSSSQPAVVDPTPDPSKPPDEQQLSIGDARYNRRDFDGAIEAYNKAIQLNPNNSWGYRNRGAALVQKDLYENAIADYEQAIKLDPKRWKESLGESIKDLKEMVKRN